MISAGAVTAALALGRLSTARAASSGLDSLIELAVEMAMFVPYVLQSAGLIAVLLVGRTSGTAFTISLIALYFIWQHVSLFPAIIGDYYGATAPLPITASSTWQRAVAANFCRMGCRNILPQIPYLECVFYGAAAMAFVSAMLILVLRFMPAAKSANRLHHSVT